MDHYQLAQRIARAIFECPQGCGDDKVQRIELKGGSWPANETDLGGLCEDALVNVICGALQDAEREGT